MGFVGGFFKKVGGAIADGVGKVAEAATGGFVGKMIADALGAMGLPPEICKIMASIGDPTYGSKYLAEQIDRVGQALGLPPALTGALKKLIEKADDYAKAFATGGFGAVVAEIGKDLGLPPALCEALAAAVDMYTGNAPGAAMRLAKLGAMAAEALGVPASVTNVVAFAADAYAGNTEGMIKNGMEIGLSVIDSLDIPEEFKTLAHLGAAAYNGDEAAIQAHSLELAGELAVRMGAPPEAVAILNLIVAIDKGDEKGMREAGIKLAQDVAKRLPPEIGGPLNMAIGLYASDPAKAEEMIKNLPENAQNIFKIATDQIKDPSKLKEALGGLVDDAKAKLSDAGKKALDLAKQVASGNTEALKAELKKYTDEEIKNLPPEGKKALELIKHMANGDTEALKKEFEAVKNAALNEINERSLEIPVRA